MAPPTVVTFPPRRDAAVSRAKVRSTSRCHLGSPTTARTSQGLFVGNPHEVARRRDLARRRGGRSAGWHQRCAMPLSLRLLFAPALFTSRMLPIPHSASPLHCCMIRWLQSLLKPTFQPLTARHVRAGQVGGDGAHPREGEGRLKAKERARRRPGRRTGGSLQGAPSCLRGRRQREGPREGPKGRLWARAIASAGRGCLGRSTDGLGRLGEPLYAVYCTMQRMYSCLCPLLSGGWFALGVQHV